MVQIEGLTWSSQLKMWCWAFDIGIEATCVIFKSSADGDGHPAPGWNQFTRRRVLWLVLLFSFFSASLFFLVVIPVLWLLLVAYAEVCACINVCACICLQCVCGWSKPRRSRELANVCHRWVRMREDQCDYMRGPSMWAKMNITYRAVCGGACKKTQDQKMLQGHSVSLCVSRSDLSLLQKWQEKTKRCMTSRTFICYHQSMARSVVTLRTTRGNSGSLCRIVNNVEMLC